MLVRTHSGGFDQMTAVRGRLLGNLPPGVKGGASGLSRSSDSHVSYTEPTRRGSDFWPGEFHKTYVHARKTVRRLLWMACATVRVFAVAGDLVTALDIEAASGQRRAFPDWRYAGGRRRAPTVTLTIRFRDPDTLNPARRKPTRHPG